jgi:hypothetical protein
VTSRPPAHWPARHPDNDSTPHEHMETSASRNRAGPPANAFAAGTAPSPRALFGDASIALLAGTRRVIATHAIARSTEVPLPVRSCFGVGAGLGIVRTEGTGQCAVRIERSRENVFTVRDAQTR